MSSPAISRDIFVESLLRLLGGGFWHLSYKLDARMENKSLAKLTGRWQMNKELSDDISPILALQGTNALMRKAISSAAVVLEVSQSDKDHYTVQQHAVAAAVPGTTEEYILDDTWRTNTDPFFGKVKGRSSWINISEVAHKEGLQGDWEDLDDGRLILAEGGHEDGSWEATRIWGFEKVQGQQRWVQRVNIKNSTGERHIARMVYDLGS